LFYYTGVAAGTQGKARLARTAAVGYYRSMFNSIRGTVTERRSDLLRLETGGVEWEFAVPSIDSERFPAPGT
jgi:hypothetical protein